MVEKGIKARRILGLKGAGKSDTEIAREVRCARQYVHFVLRGRPKTRMKRLENKELLTTSEAAYLLRVSVNTIRKWSDSGLLASYKIGPRGDRRFKRTEMMDYLISCEVSEASR